MISVQEMFEQAAKLPERMPELSSYGADPVVRESARLSPQASAMLEAFKPLLERADLGNSMVGRKDVAKRFEHNTKLVMAQMLRNTFGLLPQVWHKEATLAGTDIPSYARQNIAMILRAFPRMFATQLFPVTPLAGPDGRIYFFNTKYNTALTTSSPTIASGDRLDDITKFNSNYAVTAEQGTAKALKVDISSIVVSASSYRLASTWTYEAEDDMSALYGESVEQALINEMTRLMGWTVDRTLIDAAVSDANSTGTWTAQPAGYSTLAPSEKKAYDETLWADGILPLITAMQRKRSFNTSPDWFVVGTTLAERIQKLTSFVPFANAQGNDLSFNTGALRDVGTLSAIGIRVLVDPQLSADVGVMGHYPANSFDPAIHFMPYRPVRVTGRLERPVTGDYDRGVYSRFGVARKNGSYADSSQLGDAYGTLTVS